MRLVFLNGLAWDPEWYQSRDDRNSAIVPTIEQDYGGMGCGGCSYRTFSYGCGDKVTETVLSAPNVALAGTPSESEVAGISAKGV